MPTPLPPFSAGGHLPPGDYELSLADLAGSLLVAGPMRRSPTWDAAWRAQLVSNLGVLVRQLWAVGIDQIFADGSFVEDKDHPNDIDGYFACDPRRFVSGQLEHELNKLDPKKCWTWDDAARTRSLGSAKHQLPMWHAYHVELYPHYSGLIAGQDKYGNPMEFPAFFRKTRGDDKPKGIIKIIKPSAQGANP